MKRIGIILTPDVRSNVYLSKLVDNKIKLDQIIFMNDNRERKKFSNKEVNQARLYGIKMDKSVKTILDENNMRFKEFPFVDINNSQLINFIKQSNMGFFKTKTITKQRKFVQKQRKYSKFSPAAGFQFPRILLNIVFSTIKLKQNK